MSTENTSYYTIPINEEVKHNIVNDGLRLKPNTNVLTKNLFGYNMGTSTIGRGHDNGGDYISYYDVWDINPLRGGSNTIKKFEPLLNLFTPKNSVDILKKYTHSTNPVSFYDRIYLDDYYNVPNKYRGGSFLPEVVVHPNNYANGGLLTKNYFGGGGPVKNPVNNTPGVFIPWGIPQDNTPTPKAGFTREADKARRAETQQNSQPKYSQPAVPVNSEPTFKSDYPNAWGRKHQTQWYNFLKKQGLDDNDAARLSLFFTAQDDVESATGTSNYAKRKNNYGGMERVVNGKNVGINYPSVEAYMADKWKMMNRKFSHALGANSIEEYAAALGHPDQYLDKHRSLYYVYGNNVNMPGWREHQIGHMNNYINGMKARAGIAGNPYLNGGFNPNTYVAQNYQDMYNVPEQYKIPEDYAFPNENIELPNLFAQSYVPLGPVDNKSTGEYNAQLALMNNQLLRQAEEAARQEETAMKIAAKREQANRFNNMMTLYGALTNRDENGGSFVRSILPMLVQGNQDDSDSSVFNMFGNYLT